jgi:hypothetical protein
MPIPSNILDRVGMSKERGMGEQFLWLVCRKA